MESQIVNRGAVMARQGGLVFLSHTGQDEIARNFAAYLCHSCEKLANIRCLYDVNIPPGFLFEKCIRESVKTCRVFVAILSPTYFSRYWCMHELDLALLSNRPVLPIFYQVRDRHELPSKVAFFDAFSTDNRVDTDTLNRWWHNVSVTLPSIQALHRSDYCRKDGDVMIIEEVIESVKRFSPRVNSAKSTRNSFLTNSPDSVRDRKAYQSWGEADDDGLSAPCLHDLD